MTARISLFAFLSSLALLAAEDRLPNTQLLTVPGDLASNLVAGVDRFLLKQLEESEAKRARHWRRDFSSHKAYDRSVQTNRARLAHIIGARDAQVQFGSPLPPVFGAAIQREGYAIQPFRMDSFGDTTVEGLVLFPRGLAAEQATAAIVAIPDADVTPEQLVGLEPGVPPESQFPLHFVKRGCVVLVPALIDRAIVQRRNAKLSNREFLYRSAFELGRNLIGYETLKIRSLITGIEAWADTKIGIIGYGEGAFIALCTASLDNRVDATMISGYFEDRRSVWKQPIDRNVFGMLDQFGDAEIASLVAPRPLVVEAARGPQVAIKGEGGAPALLKTPELSSVRREFQRAKNLTAGLNPQPVLELVVSESGDGPYLAKPENLDLFVKQLGAVPKLTSTNQFTLKGGSSSIHPAQRLTNQIHEIDRHNQWLLTESPYVRAEFMKGLDTSSPEKYAASSAKYREIFYNDVIGKFDLPLMAANPKSRLAYDKEKWVGYEVTLDVFPDVMAYGVLLLPKDLKPGEKRPVVVCQHGLEGRPQDLIEGDKAAYHDYAAKLAERGFITFAPQNLYIFTDRFRTLQRKANPLGKTLFSIITPQHQQIINWLKSLPNVDPNRIGFYGLSYGGKTAMRVPALLTDYALSICSADFNEWVWKNASTRSPYSYVWTGEYEIFEFDLGSTFNYAEMAALIAPRPFMVERGHFDGVAPDETVGYEFAKVRHLYAARLKLPAETCQIEWFVGPHTINGKGTFDFLHHHLNWPKPKQ